LSNILDGIVNLVRFLIGFKHSLECETPLPITWQEYRLLMDNTPNEAVYCFLSVEGSDDLVVYNNPKYGCYIATVSDFVLDYEPVLSDHLEALGYHRVPYIDGAITVLDCPLKYTRCRLINGIPVFSNPVEVRVFPGDLNLPLSVFDNKDYFINNPSCKQDQETSRFEAWLRMRNMLPHIICPKTKKHL
jgi:hypothetical protein